MKTTKIKDTKSKIYPGLTVLHAAKDGGPVIRLGCERWYEKLATVNGLMVSTDRWGTWCWEFRRTS